MITNVIYAVLVLGVIAVVFGLILSVAAKAFEVKVDERLPKIQACLAGANCGGCGYPGCAGSRNFPLFFIAIRIGQTAIFN